jgi:hypothetical protein
MPSSGVMVAIARTGPRRSSEIRDAIIAVTRCRIKCVNRT